MNNEVGKTPQQKAVDILASHLDMLANIPTETMTDNPVLLLVVSDSIKSCSLALSLITRI